jgi:hypothetical protein
VGRYGIDLSCWLLNCDSPVCRRRCWHRSGKRSTNSEGPAQGPRPESRLSDQRDLWKRSPRPSAWAQAGILTLYQTLCSEWIRPRPIRLRYSSTGLTFDQQGRGRDLSGDS